MNSDEVYKLDEIINVLDNSADVKKMLSLKKRLLENKELLNKISLVKEKSSSYNNEYVSLKNEIISSREYSEYKEIENDLYFLVQDINIRLKSLLKGDVDENN